MSEKNDEQTESTKPIVTPWDDQGYSLYRIADALERIAGSLEGIENDSGSIRASLRELANRHGDDRD